MRTFRLLLCILSLSCLVPQVAWARSHRGYVEVTAGAHMPLVGSRYQDLFGPGPVIGFRGGAMRAPEPGVRHAFALEFGFEWTHPSDDVRDLPDQTFEFDEWRCLFGVRWMYDVRPALQLYVRGMGGVEVLNTGGSTTLNGRSTNLDKSDAGIAAQVGVGISWKLPKVSVGLELALPWSDHRDDGVISRYDVDTAYNALSIDLMLTVSTHR